MTDDIVERLRHDAFVCHVGRLPRESKLLHTAADEIERLRAGGCARDQRTTQFCAEAVALQSEIERLREALRIEQEELAACCIDRKETQRERDEARREVCMTWAWMYRPSENAETEARKEAKRRGWSCFKVENNET